MAVKDSSGTREVEAEEADNSAIAIIVTTDVAVAISVDAADNGVADKADKAPANRHRAANKEEDSARHSRPSFPMVKRRDGSIRSAKAVSSADQQIVIWPSLAMRTYQRR